MVVWLASHALPIGVRKAIAHLALLVFQLEGLGAFQALVVVAQPDATLANAAVVGFSIVGLAGSALSFLIIMTPLYVLLAGSVS